MRLTDTIEYFIEETEAELEGISWEIREETNFENNTIEYLSSVYDETEQHLNNLKEIKSILGNK
jgi:hypothetical protein